MIATTELFSTFACSHDPASPLVIINAWDAGSARAVADAGATVIGTSSWAVAASRGYRDGEELPFDLVLTNAALIVDAVALPVTIDVEGGYGASPAAVTESLIALVQVGVVGCNLEDGFEDGKIRSAEGQAQRISASRSALDIVAPGFFINARTDLFLLHAADRHGELLTEAIFRAEAYAAAGASGLFAPGLSDPALISELAKRISIPLNVMTDANGIGSLRRTGAARISLGPAPYLAAMQALANLAGGQGQDPLM